MASPSPGPDARLILLVVLFAKTSQESLRREKTFPIHRAYGYTYFLSAKWHELSVPFLLVLAVWLVAAMTLVPSWLSTFSISPQSLIFLSGPFANNITNWWKEVRC